jgi:hypothetical protein
MNCWLNAFTVLKAACIHASVSIWLNTFSIRVRTARFKRRTKNPCFLRMLHRLHMRGTAVRISKRISWRE